MLASIKQLGPHSGTQAAFAELFFRDENGATSLVYASSCKAPVEVLESMILLSKLEKKNILDITSSELRLPLYHTSHNHPDPVVIKLLVRHYPSALLAKSKQGRTALDRAILRSKSPVVLCLLRKLTAACEHGHFSGLVRLCGTSSTLQALAVRSTDDVPLRVLCDFESWDAMSARIEKIPTQATIEEIHEENEEERTTFATAVVADAPVELLESMIELGKQDTKKKKRIMAVCDKEGRSPFAAVHRTDTASIKLLARECPAGLYYGLQSALEYNKKSTAVVSLLRKYFAAWEHGNISPLIDLCGESNILLWYKEFLEKCLVHHVAACASDIDITKPVVREHSPDLLTEDKFGRTPLDNAKINKALPAVLSFMTEVDAAFHNCDYPGLVWLCGSTPDGSSGRRARSL